MDSIPLLIEEIIGQPCNHSENCRRETQTCSCQAVTLEYSISCNRFHIHDLQVKKHQRCGYGTRVVEALIDHCQENDYVLCARNVVLESSEFWEKMGFTVCECNTNYYVYQPNVVF